MVKAWSSVAGGAPELGAHSLVGERTWLGTAGEVRYCAECPEKVVLGMRHEEKNSWPDVRCGIWWWPYWRT